MALSFVDSPASQQLAALVCAGAPPGPPPGPPAVTAPAWAAIQWEAVTDVARHERLDALLYVALLAVHGLEAVPPAQRAQLEAGYWRTKVANLLAFDAIAQLLTALHAVSLPVVLLDGAALAFDLYCEPARRPLEKIDLLVCCRQASAAGRVLRLLGYAPVETAQPDAAHPVRGMATYVRGARTQTVVTLCWTLEECAGETPSLPLPWFWEQTQRLGAGALAAAAPEVRLFTAEAQLIHQGASCRHLDRPPLRQTYDVALLLARRSLHWPTVRHAMQEFQLAPAMQRMFSVVAADWGVTAPA